MEDNHNVVDIHVVIPDFDSKGNETGEVSGNPFAILATCASIFYNVGKDLGFSRDGMIKNFTEKIDKLVEHDKIE